MKQFISQSVLILCAFFYFSNDIKAQEMPPQYVFVELSTNTPCPICVSQNPGFFNFLNTLPDVYHQISFYPGRPYNSCPIYQANTEENDFWRGFRNLSSTPRVFLNGQFGQSSASVNNADIDPLLGQLSPYYLEVDESGTVNRTVGLDISKHDAGATNDVLLFGAIVEREVTLTGIPGNWEADHHNVFRKFLTPKEGVLISGSSFPYENNYSFSITEWDAAEIYTIFWLQDASTGAVLNSGTTFDPIFDPVSKTNTLEIEDLILSPNPTSGTISIRSEQQFDKVEVYNMLGKRILTQTSTDQIFIDAPGTYSVKLFKDNAVISRLVTVVQ